ETNSVVAPF
ncbi:hypothetical protein VCEC0027_003317B, partial [Vibrio cholerae O1 str. EC-0027]